MLTGQYSRANHMDEYLVRLQAQEESDRVLSRTLVDVVERVRGAMPLDQKPSLDLVVKTMRHLKLVKHLDHVVYIYCQIAGVDPITLTAEQKARFRRAFMRVNDAWPLMGCQNFLPFPFIAQQLLRMQGVDAREFVVQSENQRILDHHYRVWRDVCRHVYRQSKL